MKNCTILLPALLVLLCLSCGKQQTNEEQNAEVERQVEQRLAAEHQADRQKQLDQRARDLDDREAALAQNPTGDSSGTEATSNVPATRVQQDSADAGNGGSDENDDYNTFYTKLEPYGAWRETADYGYVFQPQAAERSPQWRPYTDGRWVYTDAGWTWDSNEPFGWATYHYGRWTRLRGVGWVWVPGEQWAPAWVSWRMSDQYVGWAPLPPEARFERGTGIHHWADNYYDIGPEQYAFVAANDFGDRQLQRNVVPTSRNVTIINQTTNVTNISYQNTTIVNQGPEYDDLRRRSRQPIERLRLERHAHFGAQNPQSVVHGQAIEMPAPVIRASGRHTRPPTVQGRIEQAVVERGWSGISDREAAERARNHMQSEATPPPSLPPRRFNRAASSPAPPTPAPAETPSPTPGRIYPTNPGQTPAVTPNATSTVTPNPSSTPAPTTPAATLSPTPVRTGTPIRERLQPNEVKEERARQLQKEREAARAKEATPSPSVASTPLETPLPKSSPIPSATETQGKGKGHKQKKEQTETPSPTASPKH